MSEKFKIAGYIVVFLIVALLIEEFRLVTGIPVTILDLVLTPLFVIFTYYFIRNILLGKKNESSYQYYESRSFGTKLGVIVGLIFMLILGVWALWAGIEDPGGYFSGVKGAAHGYTLIVTGVVLVVLSVSGVWLTLRRYLMTRSK